jgi:polysaccharide biosynthesis protein PslH
LLVHRLPFPPNKGDKVRSYHLLKHLAENHKVFLGTFIDDPADEIHLDTVRRMCFDMHAAKLSPPKQKIRSSGALLTGQALSLRYYGNAALQSWVRNVMAKNPIDSVLVFSSVMGQYVDENATGRLLVDFVDVDSAKWSQYAVNHRWPLSWLYRREGKKLLAYERELALRSKVSFFVTDNEVQLFLRLAPECSKYVEAMGNGVDSDYFSVDPARSNPFPVRVNQEQSIYLVFTGAMDYWPNVDAVTWFVAEVFPALKKRWAALSFYIVGRSPTAAVLALASHDIVVTGTVADVRPYLQHANVVVAPLRLARGIQNKILEAMAMARPVVASQSCVRVTSALPKIEIAEADTAEDFLREIEALLRSPEQSARMGLAGRQRVVSDYSWSAHLGKIDKYIDSRPGLQATVKK